VPPDDLRKTSVDWPVNQSSRNQIVSLWYRWGGCSRKVAAQRCVQFDFYPSNLEGLSHRSYSRRAEGLCHTCCRMVLCLEVYVCSLSRSLFPQSLQFTLEVELAKVQRFQRQAAWCTQSRMLLSLSFRSIWFQPVIIPPTLAYSYSRRWVGRNGNWSCGLTSGDVEQLRAHPLGRLVCERSRFTRCLRMVRSSAATVLESGRTWWDLTSRAAAWIQHDQIRVNIHTEYPVLTILANWQFSVYKSWQRNQDTVWRGAGKFRCQSA